MAHILILGGGAAGLAAALAAAQAAPAARVTVLERNPKVGKKLLATGNGRCNLDNTAIAPEKYFTADPAALRPLLAAVDAAAPSSAGLPPPSTPRLTASPFLASHAPALRPMRVLWAGRPSGLWRCPPPSA